MDKLPPRYWIGMLEAQKRLDEEYIKIIDHMLMATTPPFDFDKSKRRTRTR